MPKKIPINYSGTAFMLTLSISAFGTSGIMPVYADAHEPTPTASGGLGYESSLIGYRTLDGGERSSWKESNDTVGEIGGWRSYANEAYQATQAEANAKSEVEAHVESEAMEAAVVTTPIPAATAKRIDSTDTALTMETAVNKNAIAQPMTLSYQSATSGHRFYDDNPPGDWKAANDRVGEIGGWRTYAKEAYEATRRNVQKDAEVGSPE